MAVAGFAVLAGALAVQSMQIAVTLALLVLLVAVRLQSRNAGLLMLWGYWLLAPLTRRLLDLAVATPGADPLSLLPILGTGALALLELNETQLSGRARLILAMGAIGFALGIPMGMLEDPAAASFAAVAYLAGLSAFVIGWGDGARSQDGSTLRRALAVALLPLSAYAIAQYFFPLASWDAEWVASGELVSIGAPEEGRVRVFSTLNSPFTFSIALVIGILLSLGLTKRKWPLAVVAILPLVTALSLTYMRSAWLALAVGILVFAMAARGRAAGRVVTIVAVCVAGLVVAGDSSPTTSAFSERLMTLGSPGEDISARERLETTERLLPASINQPLGAGIGQAGLASERIGGDSKSYLVNVDDGYLSLLFQSGPFGLLLVLAALTASVVAAVRGVRRSQGADRQARAALLAAIVALLVVLAAGDVLFGLPGAILWYLCGLAVATVPARRTPGPGSAPALGQEVGLVQSGRSKPLE